MLLIYTLILPIWMQLQAATTFGSPGRHFPTAVDSHIEVRSSGGLLHATVNKLTEEKRCTSYNRILA